MWARCMSPDWWASMRRRAAAPARNAGRTRTRAVRPSREPAVTAIAVRAEAPRAVSSTVGGTARAWRDSRAATGDITLPRFDGGRPSPPCDHARCQPLNARPGLPIVEGEAMPWSEAHVRRLFWRAGFGATPAEAARWASAGQDATVKYLLNGPRGLAGAAPRIDGKPLDPLNVWSHQALWWLDR